MDIGLKDWNTIKKVFAKSQSSNMHSNIATVSEKGVPNITPIGTVFLNEDGTGFIFDAYSQQLSENLKLNNNVCISAVNSSKLFWLSSFIKGQFNDYPGVRLYATLGELKLATESEQLLVNNRIRSLKWTKGSKLIWSHFTHVRQFKVHDYRWIQYPKMMNKLT